MPTGRKAAKEKTVTLFHGNKALVAAMVVCFASVSLVTGTLIAQKKSAANLYEKKLHAAIAENERQNNEIF